MLKKFISLSTKIYNTSCWKEYRRMLVFVVRSMLQKNKMEQLIVFFDETPLKREIAIYQPFVFEQATRQVFYKSSKFSERYNLIKNHFNFSTRYFSDECLKKIYFFQGIILWQENYQGQKLSLIARFEPGQKKEGLLSIVLQLDELRLYQIIFWIDNDKKMGKPALWIGALQGLNASNASEIIKGLTKHFFGYRTKNLMLYATRSFARAAGIETIYAVSNSGYYANNHLRIDRKLKTSLDDFWQEAGGAICNDERFYELPVVEYRKSIEEIKTHKRSQYRKRFENLDLIEAAIEKSIAEVRR